MLKERNRIIVVVENDEGKTLRIIDGGKRYKLLFDFKNFPSINDSFGYLCHVSMSTYEEYKKLNFHFLEIDAKSKISYYTNLDFIYERIKFARYYTYFKARASEEEIIDFVLRNLSSFEKFIKVECDYTKYDFDNEFFITGIEPNGSFKYSNTNIYTSPEIFRSFFKRHIQIHYKFLEVSLIDLYDRLEKSYNQFCIIINKILDTYDSILLLNYVHTYKVLYCDKNLIVYKRSDFTIKVFITCSTKKYYKIIKN